MFGIAFTSGSAHGGESHRRFGVLTVGEHQEEFLSSLDVWREPDYERQWRDGVTRLLFREDEANLVTSVDARRATWFALRRDGHDAVVRPQRGDLDPTDPYAARPLDVQFATEWRVPLDDVKRYLERA